MTFRWFLGLCIVKTRVVGRIHQLPAGLDPVAKGSVQKQAPWRAYGMKEEWDDTDLSTHDSREAAGIKVEGWYRSLADSKKNPCPAHFSYRADCVSCGALNK